MEDCFTVWVNRGRRGVMTIFDPLLGRQFSGGDILNQVLFGIFVLGTIQNGCIVSLSGSTTGGRRSRRGSRG